MGRRVDWDAYGIPTATEITEGGCLGALVAIGTLFQRKLVIETTTPQVLVRPANSAPLLDVESVDVLTLGYNIGEPNLPIIDFDEFNTPEIKFRIVKKE